jgi:cysteinyl-tRNA synthetase
VLERGYTGRELRYALISGAAYAKNLNFTWQGMDDAKTALMRIDEWRKRIKQAITDAPNPGQETGLSQKLLDQVSAMLAEDLNVAGLLGTIFQWIRETNKLMDGGLLTRSDATIFDSVWAQIDAVLGLGDATVTIPPEIQKLLDDRAAARKGKDFGKSDKLRKQIEALGWKVKDTAKGQELLPG